MTVTGCEANLTAEAPAVRHKRPRADLRNRHRFGRRASGRLAALLSVAVLVAAAACGGSDGATGGSSDDDGSVDAETAEPLRIEHEFGDTTIEGTPERVVTLGVGEHDYALSLGVTPVGLRTYYPGQPFGVWPWAQDELGDGDPELISPMELNVEQIASLRPDVIMAMSSAIDDREYELLSQIAPTVARPPGTGYQSVD